MTDWIPALAPIQGPRYLAFVMALGYGAAAYRLWATAIRDHQWFSFFSAARASNPLLEKIKGAGFSEVILPGIGGLTQEQQELARYQDRKSTRLNSSH